MIGRLEGKLATKQPPTLLLDVNGVGYEVDVPLSIFYELPETGGNVALLTHMVVREDSQTLYGFLKESERALFRGLIKVSGIGPRLALGILSGMSAAEFGHCIEHGDATRLTTLPGVGKKTAERLIVELRGRLDLDSPASTSAAADDPASEAAGALTALGYKPNDAAKMVRAVDANGLSTEQLIHAALKARGAGK